MATPSGADEVRLAPRLERGHRRPEHVGVELEADLLHLARLRFAQHLAGAADLEVVHREEEAGAQVLHHLDRLEPLLRLRGQRFLGRRQQVRIGLVVRAADAPAQLVQLREPEAVGALDDDGVRRRHVDPGLDDRRADEEVDALRVELAHHVLEVALAHLPVRDRDPRLGHQLREPLGRRADGVDVVVQEVDLAAALQLAQHRLADDAARVCGHERLDREPPLRRGRDHREVADPLERHRERARDRRRRQRQHVDLGAQPLQLLLLAHAEPVLLVDDDEAEVPELDVRLDQLVRADHEVDRAGREALQRGLHFLRRAEARQLDEPHRQVGEAVGEHLEVLLGEQRRRHQHRDLLAVGERDERRAQRDLGLAEADVAADQPVHRLAARQVA